MQVSVETTEGLERRMTVGLPAEDIDKAVDERLRNISKTARMKGFRPGKVPLKVVRKRYEPQVRGEVLGSLINTSYVQAIQQEKLNPAGSPNIEPVDDAIDAPAADEAEDIGFRYVAVFEVYPEVEPVYDERISITRQVAEVSEEDIDRMVENLREQRKSFDKVERAAQDGDQLIIDFKGRLDGEEFDGGAAEEAPLVLGSGNMIPGFEEHIIGMSAGEDRTIAVTFPEDYQAEHLAGKETEFDIHVREVREATLPEVDEELVRSFGIEDGTLESLRADIRRNMERELQQKIEQDTKQQIMDGLAEINSFDVPAALVKDEIERQKEKIMQQMPEGSDSSFLSDDLFREGAEKRIRIGLVMAEIIKRNEISADDDKVRARIERLASSYQDPREVIDHYYGDKELLRNVEGLVMEDAVVDAVLAAATVSDESTTFQDIMHPPAPEAPAADSETEQTS